jgi:hypothetical protein
MPPKLKIGEQCNENKQCINNNCINNRCTRKKRTKQSSQPNTKSKNKLIIISSTTSSKSSSKSPSSKSSSKSPTSKSSSKSPTSKSSSKKLSSSKSSSKKLSSKKSSSKKSSEKIASIKSEKPKSKSSEKKTEIIEVTPAQHNTLKIIKKNDCDNWSKQHSKTHNREYWFNNTTGEKSWTRPFKTNTAIIIPFRDDTKEKIRTKQLDKFISYMTDFLKNEGCYHIFVIEQSDDKRKFNRGKLLNIGYKIAIHSQDFTHFIFHDVDLLPSKELLQYYVDPGDNIVHIAKVWKRYDSSKYFGGVVSFPKKEYEKINGFPNNFWGWGGEDDELYLRAVTHGHMKVDEPSSGHYTDLENKDLAQKLEYLRENKALKCLNKTELLKDYRIPAEQNGLSTLQYKEIKQTTDKKTNTTTVIVDVLQNNHWSDNVCGIDNVMYGVKK